MIRKAIAILLLFVSPAAAQEGPSRMFEARDLFSLEAASDPQISPDGSKIAYVRRSQPGAHRRRPGLFLALLVREIPLGGSARLLGALAAVAGG
jgi:hypothetical protein